MKGYMLLVYRNDDRRCQYVRERRDIKRNDDNVCYPFWWQDTASLQKWWQTLPVIRGKLGNGKVDNGKLGNGKLGNRNIPQR